LIKREFGDYLEAKEDIPPILPKLTRLFNPKQ
jgi:hypothetical protein